MVALLAGDGARKRGCVSRVDRRAKRDMAGGALHRVFHRDVHIGIDPSGAVFLNRWWHRAHRIFSIRDRRSSRSCSVLEREDFNCLPVRAFSSSRSSGVNSRYSQCWRCAARSSIGRTAFGSFLRSMSSTSQIYAWQARHWSLVTEEGAREGTAGGSVTSWKTLRKISVDFLTCPAKPLSRWHATQEMEASLWALIEES